LRRGMEFLKLMTTTCPSFAQAAAKPALYLTYSVTAKTIATALPQIEREGEREKERERGRKKERETERERTDASKPRHNQILVVVQDYEMFANTVCSRRRMGA
jgi:hypothetical protein